MKANVIEDKCIGCGQCEAVCDSVFEIGDEGIATTKVDKINEELIDEVRMAASGCPTDAIELISSDENSKKECNCDDECDCENSKEKCCCNHDSDCNNCDEK